jgi:hypothetical protein
MCLQLLLLVVLLVVLVVHCGVATVRWMAAA